MKIKRINQFWLKQIDIKKKNYQNTENIPKYFTFIRIEILSDRTRSILYAGYRYLLISTADAPGRI